MTEEKKAKQADGTEQEAAEDKAGAPDAAAEDDSAADRNAAPETVEDGEAPDYPALMAELNDKLLRSVAELENFRRRAEKERQDTAKFAISGFARDCLTVLDNLRRGLDCVNQEDREGNPALEALAAGMELTERELIATLERHGIEKVDPLGAPFDYDRHQAMFEIEDPSQPAGTVVEVVQPGYMLNDRLLRPAMVGVSKGGPKQEAGPAQAAEEDQARAGDVKSAPDEGTGAGSEKKEEDSGGRVESRA